MGDMIYRVPEDSGGTVGVVEEAARFVARFGVRDEGFEREVKGVWARIERELRGSGDDWESVLRMGGLVRSVFEARRRYLGEGGKAFEPEMVRGARLVVCEPSVGIWDGLAAGASAGFFDEQWDSPPLSMWVGYVVGDRGVFYEGGIRRVWGSYREYVVGLVPESYVEGVEEAIHAAPVDNIHWLDDEAFLREHEVMRGF